MLGVASSGIWNMRAQRGDEAKCIEESPQAVLREQPCGDAGIACQAVAPSVESEPLTQWLDKPLQDVTVAGSGSTFTWGQQSGVWNDQSYGGAAWPRPARRRPLSCTSLRGLDVREVLSGRKLLRGELPETGLEPYFPPGPVIEKRVLGATRGPKVRATQTVGRVEEPAGGRRYALQCNTCGIDTEPNELTILQ